MAQVVRAELALARVSRELEGRHYVFEGALPHHDKAVSALTLNRATSLN